MTATLTLPRDLAVSVLRQGATGADILRILDGLVEYSDAPEVGEAPMADSVEDVTG
jgi:hypothetical protein